MGRVATCWPTRNASHLSTTPASRPLSRSRCRVTRLHFVVLPLAEEVHTDRPPSSSAAHDHLALMQPSRSHQRARAIDARSNRSKATRPSVGLRCSPNITPPSTMRAFLQESEWRCPLQHAGGAAAVRHTRCGHGCTKASPHAQQLIQLLPCELAPIRHMLLITRGPI